MGLDMVRFTEFWHVFVTVYGTAMSIGPLQQAWKIARRRSARDVSLFNFAWIGAGTGFWLIEGLLTNNGPIIIANVVGTGTYILVVAVILYYGRQPGGEAMRPQVEIDAQLNKAAEGIDQGSRWPGMSFEQGVEMALRWVTGETDEAPLEGAEPVSP